MVGEWWPRRRWTSKIVSPASNISDAAVCRRVSQVIRRSARAGPLDGRPQHVAVEVAALRVGAELGEEQLSPAQYSWMWVTSASMTSFGTGTTRVSSVFALLQVHFAADLVDADPAEHDFAAQRLTSQTRMPIASFHRGPSQQPIITSAA